MRKRTGSKQNMIGKRPGRKSGRYLESEAGSDAIWKRHSGGTD
jgi:hypothetical protein